MAGPPGPRGPARPRPPGPGWRHRHLVRDPPRPRPDPRGHRPRHGRRCAQRRTHVRRRVERGFGGQHRIPGTHHGAHGHRWRVPDRGAPQHHAGRPGALRGQRGHRPGQQRADRGACAPGRYRHLDGGLHPRRIRHPAVLARWSTRAQLPHLGECEWSNPIALANRSSPLTPQIRLGVFAFDGFLYICIPYAVIPSDRAFTRGVEECISHPDDRRDLLEKTLPNFRVEWVEKRI